VPPSTIAACILVAIGLAGGQILFKFAAQDIAGHRAEGLISVLSPWLAAALAVYVAATALWVWILMHVPISKAYPFALLAMALVPLAGHWLFLEALSVRYAVGLVLMMVGLALIQAG
jgi:undecaprenyl phosphate-alpha-L-ara4N flippase subunit ArnE